MAELTARIKDDNPLLREFELVLLDRGRMTKQDAILEAIRLWIGHKPARSEFGALTELERAVLHAVLDILRDDRVSPDDPTRIKSALLTIGKRYLAKRKE